ncbi:MAG: hypothetical protein AB7N65_29680, partial [Vicinamibacterales bacterium]
MSQSRHPASKRLHQRSRSSRSAGRATALGLVGAGLAFCCTAFIGVPATAAQQRTIWDGVYTRAQAARGEEAYKLSCGYCHKDDLSGGFMDDGVGRAVPLAGPHAFNSTFEARWKDQTLGDMVYVIASTM